MEQHLEVFVSSGEQEMELHLLTLGALAPAGGNARCAAVDSVIDEMQKSPIEKRKRNLKKYSPISRRERERDFISQGLRGERDFF